MASGGLHAAVAAHAVTADWSSRARSVWAKASRDDEASWLPLVQHLCDATSVAMLLWDHWLPPNVKRVIEAGLPEGARDGRILVAWLAATHDIGKASAVFNRQVQHLAEHARRAGLEVPASMAGSVDARIGRHATVGQWALVRWLTARYGAKGRVPHSFAAVVGSHHGEAPGDLEVQALDVRPDLVGDGPWTDVRVEILDRMAEASGADAYLGTWMKHVLPVQVQMLVTGVVVMADWIASDESRFDYTTRLSDGLARAEAAWDDLDLPAAWLSQDATPALAERFPKLAGHAMRPLQTTVRDLARGVNGPALLVVEAPMGEGKTEGALLAAETLGARSGSGGVMVALPTMATSDAMFSRVREWVECLPDLGRTSMFLAHSKAALNDEYAGMSPDARTAGIYDESGGHAVATAVSWLSGRRKGMLANFVVGTIDQVLMAALSAKHVMLRHLALAGKVVVIDEVHAADDFMRVYLCRALEWLAADGVPVVLLSATLPSAQLRELTDAYGRGLEPGQSAVPVKSGNVDYPRVSVVDRAGTRVRALVTQRAPIRVDVLFADDELASLRDLLAERLSQGGCAAVIRSTVARAQEAYEALQEAFPGEIVLVHSRFLAPDRTAREARLRDLLGPGDGARPARLVVVGTQVLEQSLDIDFDLMVSDIAPLDLVLQRVGRLHRHERRVRPAKVVRPTLVLTGVVEWQPDGPSFDRGVRAVYPEARLLRSLAALDLADGTATATLVLPDDIGAKVEAAYHPDPQVVPAWLDRVTSADELIAKETVAARGRANNFALPSPPRLSEPLGRFMTPLSDDRAEDRGTAAVREGLDGIEVIVVRRRGASVWSMPGSGRFADTQLDEIGAPEWGVAKSLAATTVRLPPAMCMPWSVDRVIDDLESRGYAGWQSSPWLSGQLVLTLDDDLRTTVGGFRLSYDQDTGLHHHREDS